MKDDARLTLARAIAVAAIVAIALLLPACEMFKPDVPVFVTTEQPAIPEECDETPGPVPQLPGGGTRPVAEAEAARDSNALVDALEAANAKRSTCRKRLRALFPQAKYQKGGTP